MSLFVLPFRVLYKLYFALFFGVSFLLFYPVFKFLLARESRFKLAMKTMKFYARLWMFGSGVIVSIKGKENIPTDGAFIICANHSSFLDIPCLYILFKQHFIFTGKKEIQNWPILHIFFTSGMNILVDRHNKKEALKAYKKMMRVIDRDLPLVILPEGTISKIAPKLGEFKPGAASLAIQKQIPILPITFTSNWIRLERKSFFKGKASPGVARVIIHPIIQTKALVKSDQNALLEKLRYTIDKPRKESHSR